MVEKQNQLSTLSFSSNFQSFFLAITHSIEAVTAVTQMPIKNKIWNSGYLANKVGK